MSLVHDDVLPFQLLEELDVRDGNLVTRHKHRERLVDAVLLITQARPRPDRRPLLLASVVQHRGKLRRPPLELAHPVGQRAQRPQDEKRPEHPLGTHVAQERDRLDRLPESHLVRQDPVHPVLIERDEPLHALELVVPQQPLKARAQLVRRLLDRQLIASVAQRLDRRLAVGCLSLLPRLPLGRADRDLLGHVHLLDQEQAVHLGLIQQLFELSWISS